MHDADPTRHATPAARGAAELDLGDAATDLLRARLPAVAEDTVRGHRRRGAELRQRAHRADGRQHPAAPCSSRSAASSAWPAAPRRSDPGTPLAPALEGAYALGRGEARSGRSMDALLAAYRVGARVAWRELSATAVEAGLTAQTIVASSPSWSSPTSTSCRRPAWPATPTSSPPPAGSASATSSGWARACSRGDPADQLAAGRRARRLGAAAHADRRRCCPARTCAGVLGSLDQRTLRPEEDLPDLDDDEDESELGGPAGARRRRAGPARAAAHAARARRPYVGPARPVDAGPGVVPAGAPRPAAAPADPGDAPVDTEQHLTALVVGADPEALADLRRQVARAARRPAAGHRRAARRDAAGVAAAPGPPRRRGRRPARAPADGALPDGPGPRAVRRPARRPGRCVLELLLALAPAGGRGRRAAGRRGLSPRPPSGPVVDGQARASPRASRTSECSRVVTSWICGMSRITTVPSSLAAETRSVPARATRSSSPCSKATSLTRLSGMSRPVAAQDALAGGDPLVGDRVGAPLPPDERPDPEHRDHPGEGHPGGDVEPREETGLRRDRQHDDEPDERGEADQTRHQQVPRQAPTSAAGWASLFRELGIRTIQISEHDSQVSRTPKAAGEFVATWSVDGFLGEGAQPAELGWGTAEGSLPPDGCRPPGDGPGIYLLRPGMDVRVRSWSPDAGPFVGYLITHMESLSIADHLTLRSSRRHRLSADRALRLSAPAPTPSSRCTSWSAAASSRSRASGFWRTTSSPARTSWACCSPAIHAARSGSARSCRSTRPAASCRTPTRPRCRSRPGSWAAWRRRSRARPLGLVEPEELDFARVLAVARPYLGRVRRRLVRTGRR